MCWKGTAKQLGPGDSVAADPNSQNLVVSLAEKDAVRLVRMDATSGSVQPLDYKGVHIATPNLTTHAVGPDGRITLYASSPAQWSYLPAILDPQAKTIARIPVDFNGEIQYPIWTPDGKIVAEAKAYQFTIWRFRPSTH